MKKLQLIFILFFSIQICFSQKQDFDELLSFYMFSSSKEIDDSLAKKYFDYIPIYSNGYKISGPLKKEKILIESRSFLGLTATYSCGAGGICEYTILLLIHKNGQTKEIIKDFEYNVGDCGFENYKYCSFISDSLLFVVEQNTTGDCEGDTLYTNEVSVELLQIDNQGKVRTIFLDNIDIRRDYYMLSTDLLNQEDLINKTKDELDTMRNEIFAAHGYIFKSDKWKQYFEKRIWYKPEFDDVENNLSFIEKKNIEMILKCE